MTDAKDWIYGAIGWAIGMGIAYGGVLLVAPDSETLGLIFGSVFSLAGLWAPAWWRHR